MQRYSAKPHVRKHGPHGLQQYQKYKPWLRDEFTFTCVYCLEREVWYPNGHHSFGVDHIKPKGVDKYKHLECDYNNLLYSCNRCNTAKASEELLNPVEVAMGDHCTIDADGEITGLTDEGKKLIVVLGLSSDQITATRKRYIQIAELFADFPNIPEVAALYHDVFGYPTELPNLRSLRPKGNTLPDGCKDCYYVRQKNATLSKVLQHDA